MCDVLIDVTRLLDRGLKGSLHTGVDRVSLAYVEHYRERAQALVCFAGRWVILDGGDSRRVFDALLNPGVNFSHVVRWCVGRSYALNWGSSGPQVLLNAGHNGLEFPDYAKEVRRRQLRPVFFLHDLIPITHPEFCRPGEAQKHHRRLDTMLSVGQGLIVNSMATLNVLKDYADKRVRVLPPCVAAPLASSALPLPSTIRPLNEPYFVVLSTIEPRKNHLLLLYLWRQLVEELGDRAPRLVVIGQRGWECEQVVDMLDRSESLRGFVIEEARCSDAQLSTWLHHAQALLFPSFAEGYGIPLVEALTIGLPVIASDLPAFREIAGDIPEYLNPLDGMGWKQLILEYSNLEHMKRRGQLARMGSFSAPTWAGHFSQVDALLDLVKAQSS